MVELRVGDLLLDTRESECMLLLIDAILDTIDFNRIHFYFEMTVHGPDSKLGSIRPHSSGLEVPGITHFSLILSVDRLPPTPW
jgi:hypothetical protein